MNRSLLHLVQALAIVGAAAGPPVLRAQKPPDIVLIVTDNERYDDQKFMPLTDSLIGKQGVRFTRAYSPTPTSSPSRASLLTGLYSHNHGVLNNRAPQGGATVFDDESTVATWLRAAGYRTGLFGRYLNDYQELAPYVPPGWAVWRAFLETNNQFFNFSLVTQAGTILTYTGTSADSHSTNVLAVHAVRFIRSTPWNKPLFLYFTPFSPHGNPPIPSPEDSASFTGLSPLRPPSYNEVNVSDKPTWVRALPRLNPEKKDSLDVVYRRRAQSLQAVDRAVAAIIQALEVAGRLSTTVLIFTSDDAMALGEHRWDEGQCVYEECVNVPLIVRGPALQPRDDKHLISHVDLAPTIAEFAGISPPTKVNGTSVKGLLSDPTVPWRHDLLLEFLGGTTAISAARNQQSVRTSRYVYAEYFNGDRELYDRSTDPFQLRNAVADPAYSSVVAKLTSRLAALRSQ